VIGTSNPKPPAAHLLEMAVDTQILISHREHLLVDGTMRVMAGGAAVAHGFVLKNERTTLRGMAPQAGLVLGQQGRAARHGVALVRIVAIPALHPVLGHLVVIGQCELAAHLQVTLETVLGGRARTDNRVPLRRRKHPQFAGLVIYRRGFVSAGLRVQAARPVARFAAGMEGIRAFGPQPGVTGGFEIPRDLVVTLGAGL
jgi:hypothetical protein